jgi:hypothetical protein
MISVQTGEFTLNDPHLVIHPGLSLSQFRSANIPIEENFAEKKYSATYSFRGQIEKMNAVFWINFRAEKVYSFWFWENREVFNQTTIDEQLAAAQNSGRAGYAFELKKWRDFTSQAISEQKTRHDAWLKDAIGTPPPYEYDWGEIFSGIEPRHGDAEIMVRFKRDFGEDIDLETFFKNRRGSQGSTKVKIIPGQLPPGFRPKS